MKESAALAAVIVIIAALTALVFLTVRGGL